MKCGKPANIWLTDEPEAMTVCCWFYWCCCGVKGW